MIKKNLTRKNITNKLHARLGLSKNLLSNILDDFFESQTGEIFYRLKLADDCPYISEKNVTMAMVAKTLITWAEKNSHARSLQP